MVHYLPRSLAAASLELHLVQSQKETGTTLLFGQLEDQVALYSVLLKLRNLGLGLVALETSELPQLKNEESF